MADRGDILSWLHVGDLHITRADEENHRALLRIAGLLQGIAPGSLDFAVLPGDNAEDGTPGQFALVRAAVARLPPPILPGDHDFKPHDLDAFHDVLGALLARPHVTCVDMGHTHYNELANDGPNRRGRRR